jgi:hypothetical protein
MGLVEKIRCERCGEILNPDKVVWLELSLTDGRYYNEIPHSHKSQGIFAFGSTCAKKEAALKSAKQ